MMEQPATPTAAMQLSNPTHHFSMRFSSTPRGARLARRLAAVRLDSWGYPYDCTAHADVTLLVAELCANAIQHGHVPGRDFRLDLKAVTPTTLRVEVTDTRAERLPTQIHDTAHAEHGRGLNIVAALAARWDWGYRPEGGPGKIVWAEYEATKTPASSAP